MRKTVAAVAIAALTLAGAPSASAFSSFSSSSSSAPAPVDRNESYRDAIEKFFTDRGFTVDAELTALANAAYSDDYEISNPAQWELSGSGAELVSAGRWPTLIDTVISHLEETIGDIQGEGQRVAVGIKPGPIYSEVSIYIL